MTATDPHPSPAPAGETYTGEDRGLRGTAPSVVPTPQRAGRTAVPLRADVCPSCRAWRAACYCAADVGTLRCFAREMTELHMPTGTDVCGCGSRNCVYRSRLAKITRTSGPGAGWTPA